jgi:UDP-glucose 4-epimerase
VVDALCSSQVEVLAIDDLSGGDPRNLMTACRAGARLLPLDIRDFAALHDALHEFRPDWVFHLAAQVNVRTSMVEPALDAGVNVIGSINVFAAAAAAGVTRVVSTSTGGAIYGETAVIPTPEGIPEAPVSAYGLSKATTERYARWFHRSHGLDVVTLRYGNVYGPRQDPTGDAGVIAAFCDAAASGGSPTIYGDGKQTRDFVFVSDVASANLAAARAARLHHRTYNIGTGREVSVTELAAAVAHAAGLDPSRFRPHHLPAREGEVRRSCLDVTRARRDLGVSASVGLSSGLRLTFDWLRQRRLREAVSPSLTATAVKAPRAAPDRVPDSGPVPLVQQG